MMLSIQEAAALSGKSARTIREQARTGRLDARRVGGRWLIPRAALDGDPATDTRDARRAEVERLRQHVDAALDEVTPGGDRPDESARREPIRRSPRAARSRAVTPDDEERGFYSVRDVTSFEVMSTVRDALERREETAPTLIAALTALRSAMHCLTEGFHQYQPELKVARFIDARGSCCQAIAELTHFGQRHDDPSALEHAARLERDALGALRGLLRRAERRLVESA